MARPGVDVTIRETPQPRSAPTDTGVLFVTGLTDRGLLTPIAVHSMAEFERTFGLRQTYSILYDALDAYFHEGGRTAYVSRVVGPAAVVATKNLLDAGAAIALTVKAKSVGPWGNNLTVQVVAGSGGGTYVLVIAENGVEVERSPDLADTAAGVAWGLTSNYVDVVQGASTNDPAVAAAAALTTGADDRASITDAHWLIAQNKFTADLGPGQVAQPGRTTDPAHQQIADHCALYRRAGLLDLPDTTSNTTLKTSAHAVTSNTRWAAAFAPWVVIPGITAGTFRTVPPSTVIAGIIARNDVSMPPGQAAAGDSGRSVYATGVSQVAWDDATRADLNINNVNVIRLMYGSVVNYGFRSLVNPVTDAPWVGFGTARIAMALAAQGRAILERYVFDIIDGRGLMFSSLAGDLTGICSTLYQENALFGETPSEAFDVLCDSTINTPTTIANLEVHAQISFRPSPMAEWVQLDLVNIPVSQSIA